MLRRGVAAEVSGGFAAADLCAMVVGMEISPTNRDHRRKPEDEKTLRDLAKKYAEGKSIRALAIETGWCYGTVHRRLALAQVAGMVVLRPRGGVVGPRQPRKSR